MPELATPHTDLALCRQSLSGGSRSFWVASKLLPNGIRNAACGLYAFCREADDLIDDGDDADRALVELRARLDTIYNGASTDSPTDRVMTQVVARHGIPRALLDALLEGFHWDASGRHYETLSDLYAYSARVAGTVGVMMSLLMGVRDRQALIRAADLGVAMQLTNICRDVGEDARAGRLYLPAELLERHRLDAGDFKQSPAFSAPLARVVRELLDDADRLYARSESGIPSLPASCRPGIYAARRLYAAIGDQVRAQHYNSVDQRAILGASGKLRLMLGTGGAWTLGQTDLAMPALNECQFLIDAVTTAPEPTAAWACDDNRVHSFFRRMLWMMELVAELDDRNTDSAPGGATQR